MKEFARFITLQTPPMWLKLLLTIAYGGLLVFVIMLLMLPPTVAQEWLLSLAGKGADVCIKATVLVTVPAFGFPFTLWLMNKWHNGLIAADEAIKSIFDANAALALPAGQALELSDGQDIFIVNERYSESRETMSERFAAAISEYGERHNIICIPFDAHTGIIRYTDGEAQTFHREEPPQSDANNRHKFARKSSRIFGNTETWQDYCEYVKEFRATWPAVPVLREIERAGSAENACDIYAKKLRLGMACFALLFAANFATAQKSVELRKYLGERCEMPAPAGEVFFKYEGVIITRKNDAKKPLTFSQLLASSPAFTDSDAGKLQKVYTRTDVFAPQPVAPEPPAQQPAPAAQQRTGATSYDPVRPRNIDGTTNTAFMLPDSLQMERNIDGAKETITVWKAKLWEMAKPVWGLVMWVFNSVLVLLICFGGICRYVAKTAANESLMTRYGSVITGRWILPAHENAAVLLLYTMWIIFIILLIDVFLWLVWLNLPLWLLLFIWFPLLWMAEKFTNWAVPNVPMAGGNYPART
jgi:hypothetical protein